MKLKLEFLPHLAATLLFSAAATLAQAQTVVLYSSNNTETIEAALNVSRKKMPSLNVQQVTGGTGALMKRIQAESKNPRGDILWSGGFGTLGAYKEYMEPYKSPDLAAIPAEFRGPNDLWVGTNVHLMVIMVNEKQLKGMPVPTTWSDLMKPEWKGKFAITDPSKSATAYQLVYGLLKQFGRDGLEKIAANAIVTSSSGTTYKGTAMGEYPIGLTIEYAAQEYVAGGQKEIRLVYPSEGSYLAPEGMFIIKGAKNPEAAKAFYNILLSKEMQQELLVKAFRRPVRTDIEVSKLTSLPDLKSVKIFPIDQAAAAEEYEQLVSLWNIAVNKAR
ncbi:MAG: ABC transporter substrate-binding protein [Candidatus Accumulibacter sp.]|jgi:iron(III) transport system substrate-binding protein|nr:ABC transporter substrate-binding protein [Accumulibacter sp.]